MSNIEIANLLGLNCTPASDLSDDVEIQDEDISFGDEA